MSLNSNGTFKVSDTRQLKLLLKTSTYMQNFKVPDQPAKTKQSSLIRFSALLHDFFLYLHV